MEKACVEMDFEDWEFLNDDGLLDLGYDNGRGLLSMEMAFDSNGAMDMDYFICPSKPQHFLVDKTGNSKLTSKEEAEFPAPMSSEPASETNPDGGLMEDVKDINVVAPSVILANQDVISHVFFKKLTDDEFSDMKMDSPRSDDRSIKPQTEEKELFQFEEKEEAYMSDDLENRSSERLSDQEEEKDYMGSEIKEKDYMGSEIKETEEFWEDSGFSIRRWRLQGNKALCSIGVAAATICIMILGGQQQRQKHQHQNQKPQFQFYTDNKSIKQVVQQATRLNQTLLSGVRGAPMTRAHISFGGYFDAL